MGKLKRQRSAVYPHDLAGAQHLGGDVQEVAIESPLATDEGLETRMRAAPELKGDRELAAFYALRSLTHVGSVMRVVTAAIRAAPAHDRQRHIEGILTGRGESQKERIERQSGRSISTEQAAEWQGVTSEAIRKRVAHNLMIGYVATGDERNRIRLPEWQFAGPKEVRPWVRRVLEAYEANGWDILDFLTTPLNGMVGDKKLDGESLLDRLQKSDVDFVINVAKRANPS